MEAEIELSDVANMHGVALISAQDASSNLSTGMNLSGAGEHMMASNGEMLPIPNNGKMLLRTPPFILTPNLVTLINQLFFDASGAAGSATALIKCNSINMRKYGVA